MTARPQAEIGVFGGSGFYSFLDNVTEHQIETPFGNPSSRVQIGTVGDRRVAFLARHGPNHELPPHRVNYRANVWAMRAVGVRRLFGPCACGSLQPEVRRGDFLIADQLVDRTKSRADTYYDGPAVHHVSFADPYCPELRGQLFAACRDQEIPVHRRGTLVTIEGPRFSTRAESRWMREQGWHVVNMTQYPEAYLARELGICYATVAVVTDYDAGVGPDAVGAAVTIEEVFRVFEENVGRLRGVLCEAIPNVAEQPRCSCHESLAEDRLTV